MGLFNRKKSSDFVDLRRFKKPETQAQSSFQSPPAFHPSVLPQQSDNSFGFLGAIANTVSSQQTEQNNYLDSSENSDDKRKKLAKRLMDITDKLEDLSNQIYHLQQRLEVIERKLGVGGF